MKMSRRTKFLENLKEAIYAAKEDLTSKSCSTPLAPPVSEVYSPCPEFSESLENSFQVFKENLLLSNNQSDHLELPVYPVPNTVSHETAKLGDEKHEKVLEQKKVELRDREIQSESNTTSCSVQNSPEDSGVSAQSFPDLDHIELPASSTPVRTTVSLETAKLEHEKQEQKSEQKKDDTEGQSDNKISSFDSSEDSGVYVLPHADLEIHHDPDLKLYENTKLSGDKGQSNQIRSSNQYSSKYTAISVQQTPNHREILHGTAMEKSSRIIDSEFAHVPQTPKLDGGNLSNVRKNLFFECNASSSSFSSDTLDIPLFPAALLEKGFDLPEGDYFIDTEEDACKIMDTEPIIDMLSIPAGETVDVAVEEIVLETNNQETDVEGVSDEENECSPLKKNSRIRQKNPSLWRKNVAKTSLARGVEHVSAKGVLRKARHMGPGCDETCRLKCIEKVSNEDRASVFKQFWATGDNQKGKWCYIALSIEVSKSDQESRKKKNSIKYFLKIRDPKVKVCKTMFLDTLGICDSLVHTAVKKMGENFCISPDKRKGGHACKASVKTEKIRELIRKHTEGLPRLPSHYSRETSNKEYLIERFQSVADMHEDYKEWMNINNHPQEFAASERQYRDVFNKEYNIGFFLSKKDLCDECTAWENTPEDNRPQIEAAYKVHLDNKVISIAMKNADSALARMKESRKILVVAHFDFEKNLICPKSNSGVFYYRRKLNVSNFTISDVGHSDDYNYVYAETVAGKGSNEVASFLNHFAEAKVAEGIKEFRLYSDNCSGQNKNRNVTAACLYIAVRYKVKVTHTFLEKGHTYNAADTMHSLVERKVKRKEIFSPGQWSDLISKAKRQKNHPAIVVNVDQRLIYDWNDLSDKLNLNKADDGGAVPWKTLRRIQVDGNAENPHEVKFKVSLQDEYRTLSTKRVGRPVNFDTFELKQLYHAPRPISQAKYKDLIYYCDKNYIPQEYHAFYRGLLSHEDVPDEEVEELNPQGRAKKRRQQQPNNAQKRKRVTKAVAGKKSRRGTKVITDDDTDNEEEPLTD